MKRATALFLVLTIVCCLCACSSSGRGKQIYAGVFWYEESDVFLGSVREELGSKLRENGIRYEDHFAEKNQSKQIDQIKAAVSDGADILLVNQVTAGSLDTAAEILTVAGDVPVIFFNRSIGSEDESDAPFFEVHPTSCFIGTDAPMAGLIQGEMIGNYLLEHYEDVDINGDGCISYAMFKGDKADISAVFRTRYSVEKANELLNQAEKPSLVYFNEKMSPDYRYQVDVDGGWSEAAAEKYMRKNLQAYREDKDNMIELVIANNDDMASGAVKALQELGYNRNDGRFIPVFGVDASPKGRRMISEGTMTGTVLQDAEGLAEAICQTAKAVASGMTPVQALRSLEDSRFSISGESNSKLCVAYRPYGDQK